MLLPDGCDVVVELSEIVAIESILIADSVFSGLKMGLIRAGAEDAMIQPR